MSARDRVSFSGVIVVLWIKNLSLHLAAKGGSSFMAWSITGSPPHNVSSSIGIHDTFQRSRRLTLDLDALTRLHPTGIWSYAVQLRDHTESISNLESNSKHLRMEADLGSGGLNFERHGLDIVIRDRQSAFHGLGERP